MGAFTRAAMRVLKDISSSCPNNLVRRAFLRQVSQWAFKCAEIEYKFPVISNQTKERAHSCFFVPGQLQFLIAPTCILSTMGLRHPFSTTCLRKPICKYPNIHLEGLTVSPVLLNKRKEYMQETQHTQQTATRTSQNQDIETTRMFIVIKTQKTHRNKMHTLNL